MEKEPSVSVGRSQESPLKEAYSLLGVDSPFELSKIYTKEDQILMKSGKWDYKNPDLITNKIKDILESTDVDALSQEERDWCNEILWFWYHHAISSAVWIHKDKEQAKEFADKALYYQGLSEGGHPNQITKLFKLLLEDKVQEAEEYINEITDSVEKETGLSLLQEFKEGIFNETK